jgi:hypothetical protein
VKSVLHSTKIKSPPRNFILLPLFVSTQLATTLITRRVYSFGASIVDGVGRNSEAQGRADFGSLLREKGGCSQNCIDRLSLKS